jgi:hypothetical protein
MSRACRLVVVVQRGRIVGTQQLPDSPPGAGSPVSARLVAGPGQRLVELVVNVPDQLRTAKEIERFHARLLPLAKSARTSSAGGRRRT